MSLRDYIEEPDYFDAGETDKMDYNFEFGFPCGACIHCRKEETEKPCSECGHNVNSN